MYKSNIIRDRIADDNTVFKTLFLIEDVSPLGAIYIDDQEEKYPVDLAHSKEFLDLFRSSHLVDGVIALSEFSDNQYIWFIDREQIEEYYTQAFDYSDASALSFAPHVIDGVISIPSEVFKGRN